MPEPFSEHKPSSEEQGREPEFSREEEQKLDYWKHLYERGVVGGPEDASREGRDFFLQQEPDEAEKIDPAWKSLSPKMRQEVLQRFFREAGASQNLDQFLEKWPEFYWEIKKHADPEDFVGLLQDETGLSVERIATRVLDHLEEKLDQGAARLTIFPLSALYDRMVQPEHAGRLGRILLRDDVALNSTDFLLKTCIPQWLRGQPTVEVLEILAAYAEKVQRCSYEDLSHQGTYPPVACMMFDQRNLRYVLRSMDPLLNKLPEPERAARTAQLEKVYNDVNQAEHRYAEAFAAWFEQHPEWTRAHEEEKRRYGTETS